MTSPLSTLSTGAVDNSNACAETGPDLVEYAHNERPGGASDAPGHGRPDGEEWST